MVADENMAKDAIDVHKLNGLGMQVDQNSYSYLVFCHSRCGNVAFFSWYISTVIVDFVKNMRVIGGLGPTVQAWYQLDGEAVQIECFTDPFIQKLLEENHISVGKLPASTTMVLQACDAGNAFKATKKKLKSIPKPNIEHNKHKIDVTASCLAKHDQIVGKKLAYAHREPLINGLVRLQSALVSTITEGVILASFDNTGIWPFSIDKILSNCFRIMTDEEINIVKQSIIPLSEKIAIEGELKDSDLNSIIIIPTVDKPHATPKDQHCLSHKRAVCMTNKSVIDKETSRKHKLQISKSNKSKRVSKERIAEENLTNQKLPPNLQKDFVIMESD